VIVLAVHVQSIDGASSKQHNRDDGYDFHLVFLSAELFDAYFTLRYGGIPLCESATKPTAKVFFYRKQIQTDTVPDTSTIQRKKRT
jgi:hypothetical protein